MEQLTLFQLPPATPLDQVYVGCRNGFIKIGTSTDPARRARQLKLLLIAILPGGPDIERSLHQRFARHRIDREWFMPAPAILQWVTRLQRAA